MIIKDQCSDFYETLNFLTTRSPLEQFAIVPLVPKRIHRFRTSKKESILRVTPDYLFQFPWFSKYHTNTRLGIPIDIRGVDYPSQERRSGVVHNSPSIRYNSCIRVRIGVDEITSASSVISISPSAGRWEREVWDTFGLHSSNYPDSRRTSTDYGFEGHSLRKDFPLSGYVEVRHDDSEKRVVSEPMEMAQEFRYSDLASPWRLMPPRSRSFCNFASPWRLMPPRSFSTSTNPPSKGSRKPSIFESNTFGDDELWYGNDFSPMFTPTSPQVLETREAGTGNEKKAGFL